MSKELRSKEAREWQERAEKAEEESEFRFNWAKGLEAERDRYRAELNALYEATKGLLDVAESARRALEGGK